MKKVMVLHNPGAGDGDTSKHELIEKIESAGFKCSYSSTKDFRWENIETEDIEFLVLAGGDGTVRRIAGELLDRKVIDRKLPIGLLPMGTANNIGNTLGLFKDANKIIESWHHATAKNFDVGKIVGLREPAFFLESFGYGLFPKLMHQMKKQKKNDIDDPKERLQIALTMLGEFIRDASARKCTLEIDGRDYSGTFLLIEVMNIRSIGPNLNLAPDADPGDGAFDVVLITADQRETLAQYVERKISGSEVLFDFPIVKAKALKINWDGRHLHVDDEYIKLNGPATVTIEIREGLLQFLLAKETADEMQPSG